MSQEASGIDKWLDFVWRPGEVPIARRRELLLGAPVDGGWLVESGLGAGDTLITGPHGLLTDGGPCRLVGGADEAP